MSKEYTEERYQRKKKRNLQKQHEQWDTWKNTLYELDSFPRLLFTSTHNELTLRTVEAVLESNTMTSQVRFNGGGRAGLYTVVFNRSRSVNAQRAKWYACSSLISCSNISSLIYFVRSTPEETAGVLVLDHWFPTVPGNKFLRCGFYRVMRFHPSSSALTGTSVVSSFVRNNHSNNLQCPRTSDSMFPDRARRTLWMNLNSMQLI